jgi:aspartate/methionine/tyrosine aminotransferase
MSRALADRAARPAAAGTLAFVSAARAIEARGGRVARLDIGEPHLPTPPHIVDAALAAMRDGHTRYVAPQGLPALRDAIAAHVLSRGIEASAADVVVGSGVKPMLLYTLLALVEAGDEVLVPDPGYPGYAAAACLAGAAVRHYPVSSHAGAGRIDMDALRDAITPASRVLVLNSPSNPTGTIIDESTLSSLAELADRHDLWIVSDEIYGPLTYDEPVPRSIASIPGMGERTIVVDGFSKSYAMTGWRLGFAILPRRLVAPVTAIVGDAATCTPAFVQHAGVAALTGPQGFTAHLRQTYRLRRELLVQRLRAIQGVKVATPPGALYAFANVSALMEQRRIASSTDLATELLHEHGLACVAGAAFGARGERHLRFSFAVSHEDLDDAASRLAAWALRHAAPA